MKKFFVFFLCYSVFFGFSVSPAASQQVKEVKSLPTCIDFTDVYSRTVSSQATAEEEREMQSLASIMMGYVSALQDIYGSRLVGLSENDNEWTLLEKVNQICRQYPQMTFQRAVRAVPAVTQTIQVLQEEEFKRCSNYIEQSKGSICSK